MMRLFIAIDLSEEGKDGICEAIRRLKDAGVHGRFTRRENLHLTLAFLGETPPSSLKDAKAAMDAAGGPPFSLSVAGFGRFSDTWWVGVEGGDALQRLQPSLAAALRSRGFQLESRRFQPHLTICREAAAPAGFDLRAFSHAFGDLRMQVSYYSLMQSERISGRVVYTALFRKDLRE